MSQQDYQSGGNKDKRSLSPESKKEAGVISKYNSSLTAASATPIGTMAGGKAFSSQSSFLV
jgi:hypothetical protein